MKRMFEGIRVADFSTILAGPHATAFLADFGADVVKIEKPKVGDEMRSYLPLLDGSAGIPFFWSNRSKRSIVLELADPEGIEIATKIIKTSDVLIETFRPGVMGKFGLSYEDVKKINPNIIYCSISAYGQGNSFSKKPGYDLLGQAVSGVMGMTGEAGGHPSRVGFVLGDHTVGTYAYGAIASALFHRERTGQGQYIDLALIDCLVSYNHYVEDYNVDVKPTRNGNNSPAASPFGIFDAGKGVYVAICAHNPKHWAILCKTLGNPGMAEEPEFNNSISRAKNAPKVTAFIENWLQSFEDVNQPLKIMSAAGIPCERVCETADMITNEYLLERGMIRDLELPDGYSVKTIKAKGVPIRFSEQTPTYGKPPKLGEHEDEILTELGYSATEISRLKEKWEVK